jgi:DNA-directed RNA polymerase subunit RPC12/RpoP
MCGHSGVVHHLGDQCSLCIEDSHGEDGCYNYREKPVEPITDVYFYVCDKCSATWTEHEEHAPECPRCHHEHMRLEKAIRD